MPRLLPFSSFPFHNLLYHPTLHNLWC